MNRWRIVGVVAVLALTVGGCASREPAPSAADRVPQLSVVLNRVDAALATHRFAAAREQLKKLKADVVQARDSGELPEADAERVLEAASRLLGMLPAAPASTPTPTHQLTTATATPSRPSGTKSSTPTVKPTPTTVATPTPSTPTPTPSATSTFTPTPTPTAVPTREASSTPSPTPTP